MFKQTGVVNDDVSLKRVRSRRETLDSVGDMLKDISTHMSHGTGQRIRARPNPNHAVAEVGRVELFREIFDHHIGDSARRRCLRGPKRGAMNAAKLAEGSACR